MDFNQYRWAKPANIAKYPYESYRLKSKDKKKFKKLCED